MPRLLFFSQLTSSLPVFLGGIGESKASYKHDNQPLLCEKNLTKCPVSLGGCLFLEVETFS